MIHRVKGVHLVNEAEVNVFLKLLCFLCDPMDVGNLISGSSSLSKFRLYIWNFPAHVLLKLSLKDIEHNLTSMQNELKYLIV